QTLPFMESGGQTIAQLILFCTQEPLPQILKDSAYSGHQDSQVLIPPHPTRYLISEAQTEQIQYPVPSPPPPSLAKLLLLQWLLTIQVQGTSLPLPHPD